MRTIGEIKDDIARIESEVSGLGETLIESLDSVVGLDAQTEIARKLIALVTKGYKAHQYLGHDQEAEIKDLRELINRRAAMTKELITAHDAEIARLRQQLEWQPIETAPINTWILVLDKQPSPLSGPVSAYQSLRRIVDKEYEWITDGDLEIEPTHWMPIPPLPQAQEGSPMDNPLTDEVYLEDSHE